MCTAYEIGLRGGSFPSFIKAKALADMLGQGEPRIIRPTLVAPVVLPDGSVEPMSWGFRRTFGSGKARRRRTVVNSRNDKLASPMWADSFEKRRCLIPALSFFEWTHRTGKAVPLRFTGRDMLWIAGLWEDDRDWGPCFSMITTEPTPEISSVHDRMPAVLGPTLLQPYLSGETPAPGPSEVPLEFSPSGNFLKAPDAQQDLF